MLENTKLSSHLAIQADQTCITLRDASRLCAPTYQVNFSQNRSSHADDRLGNGKVWPEGNGGQVLDVSYFGFLSSREKPGRASN